MLPENQGATPETTQSDSAPEKTYDAKYVATLKQEAIDNRLKAKELAEKVANLEGIKAKYDKVASALGDTNEDPEAKLKEITQNYEKLKADLEAERRERLINNYAVKAEVSDVELLMSFLNGKDVHEQNVEKLIADAIEKHPVLKSQEKQIGVPPTDSLKSINIKDPKQISKFMNQTIRAAANR
jgi:hypothetical protein